MANVVPFRSRKKAAPAIIAGAGDLLSPACAYEADSIEGVRDLILKLDHVNTYSRVLILQVTDETMQRQLMANADNIEALIRIARARFEGAPQAQVVPQG